ncbi:hypothetical protein [Limosilactobacillus equigenerosi]|uniref:Uncharacterized protein n=1 Tax=Limosilactobacillus equigenerosi DSM 18793 = JCM 14505 TaxID=1423742 RepID=A0A0R1UIS8_9LACO|nr:hypothetical protein [Limosilactobacillus equigenerosi]KRL93263.1 hypothetical protein FC21_GL000002 [Limosilactobacillus equigenerosi DSM 18793 = JCM 14505]
MFHFGSTTTLAGLIILVISFAILLIVGGIVTSLDKQEIENKKLESILGITGLVSFILMIMSGAAVVIGVIVMIAGL